MKDEDAKKFLSIASNLLTECIPFLPNTLIGEIEEFFESCNEDVPEIHIEKGLDIKKVMMYKKSAFPFKEMEVGDSFTIKGPKLSLIQQVAYRANQWAKTYGLDRKYISRKTIDGCCIYRIK